MKKKIKNDKIKPLKPWKTKNKTLKKLQKIFYRELKYFTKKYQNNINPLHKDFDDYLRGVYIGFETAYSILRDKA